MTAFIQLTAWRNESSNLPFKLMLEAVVSFEKQTCMLNFNDIWYCRNASERACLRWRAQTAHSHDQFGSINFMGFPPSRVFNYLGSERIPYNIGATRITIGDVVPSRRCI